jgi:hypothetical protein
LAGSRLEATDIEKLVASLGTGRLRGAEAIASLLAQLSSSA